jgi:nicotinamide mononucleotide transporter
MYVVYGAFTLTGFFVWRNQRVRPSSAVVVEG